MKLPIGPSALALALLAAAGSVLAEDSAPAAGSVLSEGSAPAEDASQVAVEDSSSIPAVSDTFSTPTSSIGYTSSAISSYELSGIGRGETSDETVLTAPSFGAPYRLTSGIFVYAGLNAGIGYNDNVTLVPDNEIGSTMYSFQPRVMAEAKRRGDRYTLAAAGNLTRYTESSSDNFSVYDISFAGDNYFSVRSKLGWSVGYVKGSDPRGSIDRPVSSEPDRWNAQTGRALYIYGARGAKGRIEVEGNAMRKRYDNNLENTEFYDIDVLGLSGRFFYRVMPKTSMIFEVRHINNDYKLASSPDDNVDHRYLVGATWRATAKARGTIKVGYMDKDYDLASRGTASGSIWEANLRWSPKTYSVFDYTSNRTKNDSTGLGDYITTINHSLAWNHQWASYIGSRVSLGYISDDYSGVDRNDTRHIGSIGFFHDLRYNLRAALEYAYIRRSSNQDIYDYTRNITFLSLTGTF